MGAIDTLHPKVRELAIKLIENVKQQLDIDIIVISGLRTFKEQDKLYAQGRYALGKRVTNAKAGESWHNYGLAFDVVPVISGKAIWDTDRWSDIGAIGAQLGLVWGGNFKSFKDKPHFEYHPNLSLDMAKEKFTKSEALNP